MTRSQQEVIRSLHRAELEYLKAYHWTEVAPGRFTHKSAPAGVSSVTHRDALELTRANPLQYG